MSRWPLLALALSCPAASAQDVATLGMQRAAESRLEWEARDSVHPVLGQVRFAYLKRLVETPVGEATVYSRAFVLCQKDVRKLAIELASSASPSALQGLHASGEPRLACHRPVAQDAKVLQEPLLVTWEVNAKLGDVLARGLPAFPLRECAAIGVEQEVRLPEGWAQLTARIAFDIPPYDRAIDSVFVACGERSAYSPASPAPVSVSTPTPMPAPRIVEPAQPEWRMARVVASGKTNVRAAPSVEAAIVAQLAPGSPVRVQRATGDWWRAKPAKGEGFDGYIRQDRLLLR
jgi:hypothetical protein